MSFKFAAFRTWDAEQYRIASRNASSFITTVSGVQSISNYWQSTEVSLLYSEQNLQTIA